MSEDSTSDVSAPNPYEAPAVSAESLAVATSQNGEPAVRSLAFWQLFFAIILFFLSAILFLYMASIAVMIVGMLTSSGSNMMAGEWLGFVGVACFFITMLVSCVLPAVMLLRSSIQAKAYVSVPETESLHQLMKSQLHLWRTLGIIAILSLIGMLILFVGVGF